MKTTKNRIQFPPALVRLSIALLMIGFVMGCNDRQNANSQEDNDSGSDLPKLTFHRPKDFTTAVSRLVEISELIRSEEALPAAKKFKVLEVVHGTGSAAHSHYYLADSEERDDHGHETSAEKMHDLEVDLFTELDDIVRWLPGIAGDGDMDKTTWDKVNELSTSLESALDKACSGKSGAELRAAISSDATIREHIDQLSKLSETSAPTAGRP